MLYNCFRGTVVLHTKQEQHFILTFYIFFIDYLINTLLQHCHIHAVMHSAADLSFTEKQQVYFGSDCQFLNPQLWPRLSMVRESG